MADCIFCKIVSGALSAEILYQDEQVIVIPDKFPKAKVHVLIISKRHIDSLFEVKEEDKTLLGHMLQLAPQIAHQQGLSEGFRVIINTGKGGGQEINHLHCHVVGGGHLPFV